MSKINDGRSDHDVATLRGRAEARVAAEDTAGWAAEAPAEQLPLLRELRVREIVLELQTEALRLAYRALEESRQRYHDLHDAAPVGYVTCDDEGWILEANVAYSLLLGVPLDEIVGEPLARFIFPDDQAQHQRHREALRATDAPRSCELRLVGGDALPFWVALRTSRMRSGGAVAWRSAIAAIGERKKAEAALESREARYRLVFEGSSDALVTLSPPAWRIATANPAAVALFGARDAAELRGRKPWEQAAPGRSDGNDSAVRAEEGVALALRLGSCAFEWQQRSASGADVVIGARLTRLELDGQPLLHGTFRALPQPRPTMASASAANPAVPGVRGRILVIDDEPVVRKALVRVLRGHDVVTAESGEEARELLEHDRAFDAIVCDLMMAGVSGMALHVWLMEKDPELARQLIFMTGGTFSARSREYLASTGNVCLEKPYGVEAVQKLIAERVAARRGS